MNKEILYKFFDNQATVEEETLVLDWLDESPDHRREMLAERRLFDVSILLGGQTQRRKPFLFTVPRWMVEVARYAAILLLAVGVGGVYVSHLNKKLLSATNKISVPAGQRVDLVLSDGTKVCMNALSELEYPASFVGKNRNVKLRGEAFFEVAHDQDHPFVVETYACKVEVLGTKFDVAAHPERDEFSAALVEGQVRVSDNDNTQSNVILQPREMVHFRDHDFVVERMPEHEDFQWRDGLIAFRNATFAELIQQCERYFGVMIQMQRPDITNTLFTGKIRISEGLDHALWVLQQSVPFTYVRNDTKDVIFIR